MSCKQVSTISGVPEWMCSEVANGNPECNVGCPHVKRHRHVKNCDIDCPQEEGYLPDEIDRALDKRPEAWIDKGRHIILE